VIATRNGLGARGASGDALGTGSRPSSHGHRARSRRSRESPWRTSCARGRRLVGRAPLGDVHAGRERRRDHERQRRVSRALRQTRGEAVGAWGLRDYAQAGRDEHLAPGLAALPPPFNGVRSSWLARDSASRFENVSPYRRSRPKPLAVVLQSECGNHGCEIPVAVSGFCGRARRRDAPVRRREKSGPGCVRRRVPAAPRRSPGSSGDGAFRTQAMLPLTPRRIADAGTPVAARHSQRTGPHNRVVGVPQVEPVPSRRSNRCRS
jgi:hypothetical protein